MFECEPIFVFNWIIAAKYSLVYYKIFFVRNEMSFSSETGDIKTVGYKEH